MDNAERQHLCKRNGFKTIGRQIFQTAVWLLSLTRIYSLESGFVDFDCILQRPWFSSQYYCNHVHEKFKLLFPFISGILNIKLLSCSGPIIPKAIKVKLPSGNKQLVF